MNRQLDTHLITTAMPFAVEDWLPDKLEPQILVVNADDGAVKDNVEQLFKEILRFDTLSSKANASIITIDISEFSQKSGVLEFAPADTQDIPIDLGSFDLLICPYLSEKAEIKREILQGFGRLLRPDGHLLIIDNVVPGSTLRGKKARRLRTAGRYINAWMRLRNFNHISYLARETWIQLLSESQWSIEQMKTNKITQGFDAWVDQYSTSPENRLRLQAMLLQAPEKVHGFLTPFKTGDRIAFRTTELFILATMADLSE
jgi:SAM-dependent methyltransferase